ncbi:MAG: hypothetical protein Q8R25_02085 [bacterium]|nr:hypothetical protein [bacterium]
MLRLALVITFLFATSIFPWTAQAATPPICIEAKSDPDASLLRESVVEAYPQLEENQQKLIDQGLCFIWNYDKEWAEAAMGFGPEDDPEYRYPDTSLYPAGSIKVNFTLHLMSVLKLMRASDTDLRVQTTLKKYFVEVLAHEIMHVQQYIRGPILALSSANDCPDGLCDERRLADTKTKMEYEFSAMLYGWVQGRRHITSDELAFMLEWLKDHPEMLDDYTRRIKNVPYETISEPISASAKFFYRSMVLPALWTKACVEGTLDDDARREASYFLWVYKTTDYGSNLSKNYPYLPLVVERLTKCLDE